MRSILFCSFLIILMTTALPAQGWTPDLGDGRYKNPIIFADYSDPDVIRSEDDFYLVASSFNCMPGIPVLHSRDLVNWRIVGRVDWCKGGTFRRQSHHRGEWGVC